VAHNFQRPNLPYRGTSLQNDKRYQLATNQKRGMRDIAIDSDLNYLTDGLRQLDADIAAFEAGVIQGSDNPLNANSLVTTDGAGNLSWIKIQDSNVLPNSISGGNAGSLMQQTITAFNIMDGTIGLNQMGPNSVDTGNLVNGCNTLEKQAPNSVDTGNLIDGCNTLAKQAPNSVDTGNLIDGCIKTPKIAAANVTMPTLGADVIAFMNALVPIGLSIQWPGNQPPTNIPGVVVWMEANGQPISRTTYASLFALLGTTYGSGDGATTFNLPDMRGYTTVGIGSDNSTGGRITNATAPAIGLGKAFGNETHTLDVTQIPPHDHSIGSHWDVNFGTNVVVISKGPGQDRSEQTGGGLPHNNVQPSIFMRYYIRAL